MARILYFGRRLRIARFDRWTLYWRWDICALGPFRFRWVYAAELNGLLPNEAPMQTKSDALIDAQREK